VFTGHQRDRLILSISTFSAAMLVSPKNVVNASSSCGYRADTGEHYSSRGNAGQRFRPCRERCKGGLTPTLAAIPTASHCAASASGHGMSEIRSIGIRTPLALATKLNRRWSLASRPPARCAGKSLRLAQLYSPVDLRDAHEVPWESKR
jgi:hypothetical protein